MMKMEQLGEITLTENRAVDDSDMAAINKYALKPLTRDKVAIFSLQLCNDQVDMHNSRFPIEELSRINRLVIGKPLMERHDMRTTLPHGTFFRSQIVTTGNKTSVCPDVYILRTPRNADFIAQIEGGVYRQTSISFTFTWPECSVCGADMQECDHLPGEKYEGKKAHYVMHGVDQVFEGSIVAAGSQGTVFLGARGLPVCGAGMIRDQHDIETLRREGFALQACSGCGNCSCGKMEEEDAEATTDRSEEERPYPNEHACLLRRPSGFQPDSFRRSEREHNGKVYSVIMGKPEGYDIMVDQAYRYSRDIWIPAAAQAHCENHGGTFEPATGGEKGTAELAEDAAAELALDKYRPEL